MIGLENCTVQFSSLGETYSFNIETNMDIEDLSNAITNWSARTDDFTAESFCEYVNSKSTSHEAYPEESFQNLDNE